MGGRHLRFFRLVMGASQTRKILGGVSPSISGSHFLQTQKNLRWRLRIDFCDREVTENRWGDAT